MCFGKHLSLFCPWDIDLSKERTFCFILFKRSRYRSRHYEVLREYLAKIEALKAILQRQQSELKDLSNRKEQLEAEIQRSKGAISILLELAAEDEGMLSEVVETPKTTE